MRVLVTGGEGFLGKSVVEVLNKKDHKVINYDIKNDAHDILDESCLTLNMMHSDAVIHLAAQVSVPESIKKPAQTFKTNTVGTAMVFGVAKKCGVEDVIFVSSAAVYGDDAGKITSPYAKSKEDGEFLANLYRDKGLSIPVFRPFNIYGPGQEISAYPAVIPAFIKAALKDKPLIIYGTGEQTRDFIYVSDVAEILVDSLHNCKYHSEHSKDKPRQLATGKPISINDLANLILSLTDSKSKIKYKQARLGDVFKSEADENIVALNSAIRIKKPKIDLHAGLEETISWYRANPTHK